MQKLKTYDLDVNNPFFDLVRNQKEQYVSGILDGCEEQYASLLKQTTGLNIQILSSWSNKTIFNNEENTFPWHDHTGEGDKSAAQKQQGNYSGILWIAGDENCGGDLNVMIDNDIKSIPFQVGKFITLANDVFHKVTHYYGSTTRISLMISYEEVNDS
jgi:hypothetical protein